MNNPLLNLGKFMTKALFIALMASSCLTAADIRITQMSATFESLKFDIKLQISQRAFDGITDANRFSKILPGTTASRFWGNDAEEPTVLIDKLALKIGKHSVSIPEPAYSDICDFDLQRGVSIEVVNEKIEVKIKGGDAAGAYTAKLLFVNGLFEKRVVSFINRDGELGEIVDSFQK